MTTLSNHPEDIKSAIRKVHGSLAAFERVRGLPANSARDVLRGKSVAQTAEAIADELNTTVQQLFPGRYASLKRDSIEESAAHRQNAGAR